MVKMYRTTDYKNEIIEKEFIEVSDKSVYWINERTGKKARELISTNYYIWHKSKEEAVLWLKNRLEKKIEIAEDNIKRARQALSELETA